MLIISSANALASLAADEAADKAKATMAPAASSFACSFPLQATVLAVPVLVDPGTMDADGGVTSFLQLALVGTLH